MATWMDGWKPTKYPGVFEGQGTNKGSYRVRVRAISLATSEEREANRVYEQIEIREALIKQRELRDELREGAAGRARQRVGEFAKLWISTKAPTLDEGTADRYADGLEDHALPALGPYYCDVLRAAHVQAWVNTEIKAGYSVDTVRGWFRTFRTMMRDAMEQVGLSRDPTARVTFPETPEREEEPNALTPEQLKGFLEAMRTMYPRNYALTCVLAFTGLRFCHASGLQWADLDEQAGVIRVARKNIRGRIGPVSRKKRAPKEVPLPFKLADIMRQHRADMVKRQAAGLENGWCFPSVRGTLRTPGSLWKAWRGCLKEIELEGRFTVHGLRRTFNDLARRAGVDAVTTKSLTGHVTEKMREHYSSVGLDEKQQAVGAVMRLVIGGKSGDRTGDRKGRKKKTV